MLARHDAYLCQEDGERMMQHWPESQRVLLEAGFVLIFKKSLKISFLKFDFPIHLLIVMCQLYFINQHWLIQC